MMLRRASRAQQCPRCHETQPSADHHIPAVDPLPVVPPDGRCAETESVRRLGIGPGEYRCCCGSGRLPVRNGDSGRTPIGVRHHVDRVAVCGVHAGPPPEVRRRLDHPRPRVVLPLDDDRAGCPRVVRVSALGGRTVEARVGGLALFPAVLHSRSCPRVRSIHSSFVLWTGLGQSAPK
jgi:hypothetical protein